MSELGKCCPDMERALDTGARTGHPGLEMSAKDGGMNGQQEISIEGCDGCLWEVALRFCPFCGAALEVGQPPQPPQSITKSK